MGEEKQNELLYDSRKLPTYPFPNPTITIFTMTHNAPCLPPKILQNHCFQFLLGITVVPREIKDNGM